MKLSYFKNAYSEKPEGELTLKQYIENIRDGFWLKLIKEVRANKDTIRYKALKSKLPAVTVSGNFRSRDKQVATDKRLIEHSGLICIDVDKKDNPKLRTKDLVDAECLAQFVSVSGDGIKIIYRCTPTNNAAEHRRIYDAVAKRLKAKQINLKIDPIVKSIANLQYVTYDPELYFNGKTKLVIKPLPAPKRKRVKPAEDIQEKLDQIDEYVKSLDGRDVTKSYENWLLIAFGLSYSLGEAGRAAFHKLSQAYKDYSEAECDEKYDSCLDSDMEAIDNPVTIATVFQIINDSLPKVTLKNLNKKYNKGHAVGVGEDEESEHVDLAGMVRYKLFLFKKRLNKETNHVEDLVPAAINLNEFEALLKRLGFFRFEKEFVQIIGNIVEEVDSDDILRIVTAYIEKDGDYEFTYRGLEFKFSWEELVHLWRVIRAHGTTYNQVTSALDHWKPNLIEDTATESFIPYRNGVVKVTKQKIELVPYESIEKQIWKERILPRNFKQVKEVGMFETFFQNVCGRGTNAKQRVASPSYYKSLWYFGYMLQGTKRQSTARAWLIYDIKVGNSGRSGKTILGQAVGKIRNMVVLDGKRVNFQERFAFQTVKAWTDVVFIDDPSKYMSINPLFNIITGQLDADVKNLSPIQKSIKLMIASNWILENEGSSEAGRQFVTQVDDFYIRYSKENDNTITPIVDLHGKEFFTDWDEKDWNQFDTFCMNALKHHLTAKAPDNTIINDAKVMRFIQVHEEEMYAELVMALQKHTRVVKEGFAVPQYILCDAVKQYNADIKGIKAGRIAREFLNAIGVEAVKVTTVALSTGTKMAYQWATPAKHLSVPLSPLK